MRPLPRPASVARRPANLVPWLACGFWLGVTVLCGPARAANPVPPVDLLTITELTAKDAATIRSQQAAKPALAGSSDAQFEAAFKAAGMTPEQIDRFWQELSHAPRRASHHGLLLLRVMDFLAETRTPEWQRAANNWSDFLHLPAVERLSPEAARGLGGFNGRLRLPAITALEPAAASALAGVRDVSLPGVTSLPENVAAAIRGRGHPNGGILRLAGLGEISVAALRSLASFKGTVDLSGLKQLTPDMAKAIHAGTAAALWLDGVTTLTPDVAALLMRPEPNGQFATMFSFGGLQSFPPEVARHWAGVHTSLALAGVKEISADTARELVAFPGELELGVTAVTPAVARLLAEGPSRLVLSGLERLDPEVARALGREQEGLDLPNLRRLDAVAASALLEPDDGLRRGTDAPRGGGVYMGSHALLRLSGLESIGPETADALGRKSGPQIELHGIARLSPEAAQGLAAVEMWDGWLPRIGHLTTGVAQALASRRGTIQLRGLVTLDADAAAAFRRHTETLELGLRHVPEEVARGLWRQRGSLKLLAVEAVAPEAAAWLGRHVGVELVMPGLKSLSVETARALADCPSFSAQFPGITDLSGPDSAAIARAVVRAPGYLSLSSLRTVSPQALAILRERPQTGLPLDKDIRVIGGPPAKRPAGR